MVVAALFTLVAAPEALAKLPPSGKYGCVLTSTEPDQYLGDLKIKGNEYRVNKAKWGKLVSTGGRKFKFKGGAWAGLFRGEWERVASVLEPGKKITEIELTEVESGFESSYCTKES